MGVPAGRGLGASVSGGFPVEVSRVPSLVRDGGLVVRVGGGRRVGGHGDRRSVVDLALLQELFSM